MKIKKILVSQPAPGSGKSSYLDLQEKYKVTVDFYSLLKIEGVDSVEYRQQHLNVKEYSAIVFTSRYGIDHFFRIMKELRITIDEDMKYFCTSEAIAQYLQNYIQYRKRKVFFGLNTIDDLVTIATKHPKEKYFLVLPDTNNSRLTNLFEEKELDYAAAKMFRSVANTIENIEQFDYDMVLLFSPIGVKAFMSSFKNFEQGDMIIGCLGEQTAKAIKDNGLRLDIEVPSAEYTSLSLAVDDYLKTNLKSRRR